MRSASTCLLLLPAVLSQTAAADLSAPGPFAAGWVQVSVSRPGGSSFTAVLFYPAETTGLGAAYDASAAPYPAISFGHGYLQAVEKYQSTLEHLSTWGYFVLASRSAGGLFPSHQGFAEDLSHCLSYLADQNQNAGSWLFQHKTVDSNSLCIISLAPSHP